MKTYLWREFEVSSLKIEVLAKSGQIWPNFGQILAKFLKMLKRFYFASENGIFKILHILKHLTEIWREAHLAK